MEDNELVNKKKIMAQLIERGDFQGFLLLEDLVEICGEQFDASFLKKIIKMLDIKGIEIMDLDVYEIEDRESSLNDTEDFQTSLDHINTEDTIGLYLKEMSQVPLLSAKEEMSLAKRIEAGKIAENAMLRTEGEFPEQELELLETAIVDGELAWEHLIKANTRLVVSIAKKHLGRGIGFLDLIQEGNLGLIRAVDKFDYKRGFRFSTYATWWIRQAITRSIADQARTIRIPVHMIDRLRQLYKVSFELEQTLNRKPTSQEIADAMALDVRKVDWMIKVSWLPVSLDSPVGDDDDSDLAMFVEDDLTPSPMDITYQNMLREKIDEVLTTLPNREANILRLRYGLDSGHQYTLEEVGKQFTLTRERIRQIEGKALRHMRSPKRSRQLKDYL